MLGTNFPGQPSPCSGALWCNGDLSQWLYLRPGIQSKSYRFLADFLKEYDGSLTDGQPDGKNKNGAEDGGQKDEDPKKDKATQKAELRKDAGDVASQKLQNGLVCLNPEVGNASGTGRDSLIVEASMWSASSVVHPASCSAQLSCIQRRARWVALPPAGRQTLDRLVPPLPVGEGLFPSEVPWQWACQLTGALGFCKWARVLAPVGFATGKRAPACRQRGSSQLLALANKGLLAKGPLLSACKIFF